MKECHQYYDFAKKILNLWLNFHLTEFHRMKWLKFHLMEFHQIKISGPAQHTELVWEKIMFCLIPFQKIICIIFPSPSLKGQVHYTKLQNVMKKKQIPAVMCHCTQDTWQKHVTFSRYHKPLEKKPH